MAQKLRLQGEDVIEHSVDPTPFQPVLGNDSCLLEVTSQGRAKRPIDAGFAPDLRVLQQL